MTFRFLVPLVGLRAVFAGLVFVWIGTYAAAEPSIEPFVGSYVGSAEIDINGALVPRDLSVDIEETRNGFSVAWVSTSYRANGRTKVSSYEIEFQPTDREGVYRAAQRKNVFGHEVQLDPMKGEPFVWSRIVGDVLSVFSLHVTDEGGYQMQEYHRQLAEGGLLLEYQSVWDGEIQRSLSAFLKRE